MKREVLLLGLAGIVGLTLFTGCSSKNESLKNAYGKELQAKHDSLPSWVTDKDDSPFTAIGSATYKGQSYFYIKNEAIALAKMALAQKLQTKVQAMTRTYFQTTGIQTESVLGEVSKQVSSQVTVQNLSGVMVLKTFIAPDGEFFVKVAVNPDDINSIASMSHNNAKIVWQQLQADKSFKELEAEVKNYEGRN
jgi:hypothetical protein